MRYKNKTASRFPTKDEVEAYLLDRHESDHAELKKLVSALLMFCKKTGSN